MDDLEAQLQTKDKIIQQLTEGLKDKERQMQQCMEIFKPTPQVSGGSKNFIEWPFYFVIYISVLVIGSEVENEFLSEVF